jgi:hypothetical protein
MKNVSVGVAKNLAILQHLLLFYTIVCISMFLREYFYIDA